MDSAKLWSTILQNDKAILQNHIFCRLIQFCRILVLKGLIILQNHFFLQLFFWFCRIWRFCKTLVTDRFFLLRVQVSSRIWLGSQTDCGRIRLPWQLRYFNRRTNQQQSVDYALSQKYVALNRDGTSLRKRSTCSSSPSEGASIFNPALPDEKIQRWRPRAADRGIPPGRPGRLGSRTRVWPLPARSA